MSPLRKSVPYLIIVALYLVSILLVDPRGEFPLNDDWSYTRSAFLLGTQNRLHVDEWSAMSLIGQAIYGGVLVRIFKPGFLLLRLSTLTLSCCTALFLWSLLRRVEVGPRLAWIAVLTWVFNPIQFCLAFTFMTEIPFLFFVMLASLIYVRYLRSRRLWLLIAFSLALGYGFLIRQTALLFAGAFILALLVERDGELREKLGRAALAAAVFLPFVAAYYIWLFDHGGATPATRRKFELLRYLSVEQLVGNSLATLFYFSFLLLPLLIFLAPALYRMAGTLKPKPRLAILAFWTFLSIFALWWFHSHYTRAQYLPSEAYHAQMPILLNVIYDSGLGPVTLDPTYYGPPATPVYPHAWRWITIAVAVGVVILGILVTVGVLRLSPQRQGHRPHALISATGFAVLAVAAFEVMFSHLQEGGLFDRHLLVSALPLCVLLGMIYSATETRVRRTESVILAGLALLLSAWFSITATHDYLAWNRVRWELGTSLLRQNVAPLELSAGFEFNAWHNYDTFRARGNVGKVYYWWYDKRNYLIAMRPEPGYRILRKEEFFSWLHRVPVPLYALKKGGE